MAKLSPNSSFIKLTKPVKESYALGWVVFQRSWGGTVLHHSGSNTINYAILWISPSKKFSLVVTTNTAGPKVAEALDKIAGKIINKYITKYLADNFVVFWLFSFWPAQIVIATFNFMLVFRLRMGIKGDQC